MQFTPNQLFIVFDGKVHSPYLNVKRNKKFYFHFHVQFISVLQKHAKIYIQQKISCYPTIKYPK